ncbi:MAG: ABC transporter ATP-binding protein [Proteobacteria bacterium]|nr:ABC transporter ATP-binding protein [Pseudomonadota bacterium]
MSDGPVVSVEGLCKDYPVHGQMLHAVRDASFAIGPGETLALVGESGSGKSTTGRMLVGLTPATAGRISVLGETITGPGGAARLARVRRHLQLVFQDPGSALDPRMRAGSSLAEPLVIAGKGRAERAARVAELLELVGLPQSAARRFPHEFSGGQRQRLCIARALALHPSLIVCDEPVSALDVSIQAQIINLLLDLQDRFGLSYLFIAHDLAVVRSVSHRIAVMYAGRIVETADRRALFETPRHPYTRALLAAVPVPVPGRPPRPRIAGELPSLLDPPKGCAFHPRCPLAVERCRVETPALRTVGERHAAACHLAGDG